jgi:hypothetical protein
VPEDEVFFQVYGIQSCRLMPFGSEAEGDAAILGLLKKANLASPEERLQTPDCLGLQFFSFLLVHFSLLV